LTREYRSKEGSLQESAKSKASAIEKSRKEPNWLAEEVVESDIRQEREVLSAITDRLKSLETDLAETVNSAHADLQGFGLYRPGAEDRVSLSFADFDEDDQEQSRQPSPGEA